MDWSFQGRSKREEFTSLNTTKPLRLLITSPESIYRRIIGDQRWKLASFDDILVTGKSRFQTRLFATKWSGAALQVVVDIPRHTIIVPRAVINRVPAVQADELDLGFPTTQSWYELGVPECAELFKMSPSRRDGYAKGVSSSSSSDDDDDDDHKQNFFYSAFQLLSSLSTLYCAASFLATTNDHSSFCF